MKVILLRDVARIGKKGSVVEVPDGYAQNQLIPTKSAVAATPENLKRAKQASAAKTAQQDTAVRAFAATVAALRQAPPLSLKLPANEKGHLFKAVSSDDIKQLFSSVSIKADGLTIAFAEPIKTIGEHEVTISQAGESAAIQFTVAAA